MEKYFASHIFEEDKNGVPMELLVMSPEDKWSDNVRWTTAASVAGAKKNIRAKLRTVLGYDWKQVQAVDMVFGPIKKEVYFGIYKKNSAKEEKKTDTNKIVDELIQECSIENVSNAKTETTASSNVDTVENKTAQSAPENKEEKVMNKKEMVKNSNAVLMEIINKKTNEEKKRFSEILHILHDSDCYIDRSIDKPDTHVLLLYEEEGVLVTVNSAIEFGREIYTEIGQLVDETNAKAIRDRLTVLFNSTKKTEEANPYQDMAKVPAERWTLTAEVVLQYLKPGKEKPEKFTVKRKITVVKVEDKFYNGYIYHSNGQYLGHWYWNVKYNRPSFKPNQDIGNYNRISYEYAIRKALRTIGLHSEYIPDSADRYAKKSV